MKKLYCEYCGGLLEEGCDCKIEAEVEYEEMVDKLEERQHNSGFYTFQDLIDSYRYER